MIPEEGACDEVCRALVTLGRDVRDRVVNARGRGAGDVWARPVGQSIADVQYGLDLLAEDGLGARAAALFGPLGGCALLGEGQKDGRPIDLSEDPEHLLVVDPVDGTRGLMRDKRSAFFLAGCGPRGATRLSELNRAVMVEIPATRSTLSDVLCVGADGGAAAWTEDLRAESRIAWVPTPDPTTDLRHGFVTFARFIGGAQGPIGTAADTFFQRAYPDDPEAWSSIFEDQYICNGGQLHGLLTGRDLLVVDVRPLFEDRSGRPLLASHPYDHAALRLARAHGVVLTDERGRPLDAPLRLDHPVPWIGWASESLRARWEGVLMETLAEAMPG